MDTDMAKRFQKMGMFLEAARKRKGVTQKSLCDVIGLSRQNVNSWFKGEQLPPPHHLAALSHHLGITVADIIDHLPESSRARYVGIFKTAAKVDGGPLTFTPDKDQLTPAERRTLDQFCDVMDALDNLPEEKRQEAMKTVKDFLTLPDDTRNMLGQMMKPVIEASGKRSKDTERKR